MLTASKKAHVAGAGVRQRGMAYTGIVLDLGENLHLYPFSRLLEENTKGPYISYI